MKAVTKIMFLDDNGEKFFGEGPARLMRGVEATGSLRAAAMSMGMAYTKALKLIRNAENALAIPLINRSTGGKDGGGSCLTEEGKECLVTLPWGIPSSPSQSSPGTGTSKKFMGRQHPYPMGKAGDSTSAPSIFRKK